MDHAMEKVKKTWGSGSKRHHADALFAPPTSHALEPPSSNRARIRLGVLTRPQFPPVSRANRPLFARSPPRDGHQGDRRHDPRRYRRRGRLQGRRVRPQGCHLPQQDHPRRRVHPRERQVPPVRILRVPVGVPRSLAASPQRSHRAHHGVVGAPHVAAHTTERPGRSTRGLVLLGRGRRVHLRAVRCRLVPRGAQSRVHSRRSFRKRLRARLVRQGDGRRRQGHAVHRAHPVV